MSGPSIAVRRRWGEQVARFVAKFIECPSVDTFEDDDGRFMVACHACDGWPAELQYACIACGGAGSTPAWEALTKGLVVSPDAGAARYVPGFNVRGAKAAARELVALEAEQAAFEDWKRDRGLGPENREPGVFGISDMDVALRIAAGRTRGLSLSVQRAQLRGGWPGKQAREWPGDRRAPMGRALARLGRRVLEALEGQPDACEAEGCYGGATAFGRDVREYFERLIDEMSLVTLLSLERIGCEVDKLLRRHGHDGRAQAVADGSQITLLGFDEGLARCPDCHGTGDNLRGVLPEVVETRQERETKLRREARAAQCFASLDAWSGLDMADGSSSRVDGDG